MISFVFMSQILADDKTFLTLWNCLRLTIIAMITILSKHCRQMAQEKTT